jgi:hypothetical protein
METNMPTQVRDDVERRDVATSPNNVQAVGATLQIAGIVVVDARHFVVGQSYRLIDTHNPNGISAQLATLPGAGMATATFRRN